MNTPAPQILPPVPTTRVLAIGKFDVPPSADDLKRIMPTEIAETVLLYLDGKIEQWYSRQDRSGVVFVLDLVSLDEAQVLLDALPLGVAGLMSFELIPLGPLKPLRVLVQRSAGAPSVAH